MKHLIDLAVLLIVGTLFSLGACNFSDPVTQRPDDGCQSPGDCSHNGMCDIAPSGVGTCVCDTGWTGEICDACADGFVDQDGDCIDEDTICTDDEISFEGGCVQNPCNAEPCGEGTCVPLGAGEWECECPGQITASFCPTCEDRCENGTCNDENSCECNPGYAGMNCDRCAAGFEGSNCDRCVEGAFGPECLTCDALSAEFDWWNESYSRRRPIIVFNNEEQPVLDHTIVPFTFTHNQLVVAGADMNGRDVRVVHAGQERPRVLGFDSSWNKNNTTILFPTVEEIMPEGLDLYFLYAINSAAMAPMIEPTELFLQDRGWYYTDDGLPIYAANAPESKPAALQVRQKSPRFLQIAFYDGTNETGLSASATLTDNMGQVIGSPITFDETVGSMSVPRVATQDIEMTPDIVNVQLSITSGLDFGLFAGPRDLRPVGADTIDVMLQRTGMPQAVPSTFACPPEEL